MPTITIEMLEAKDACYEQVTLFRKTFPNDLTWETDAEARELAAKYGEKFDVDWASENLLTPEGFDAYEDARAPLWKAYEDAKAPLWKAYKDAEASLLKAYKDARAPLWKAYEDARAPLWKAYKDARAPLWKAYKDARAPLWKAYEDAEASLWKAYEDARAYAFLRIYADGAPQ